MSGKPTRPADRLTVREVAARLGVSRQTVYKYIKSGALRAFVWKANSRMYVRVDDLERMLGDHF